MCPEKTGAETEFSEVEQFQELTGLRAFPWSVEWKWSIVGSLIIREIIAYQCVWERVRREQPGSPRVWEKCRRKLRRVEHWWTLYVIF